MTFKDEKAPVDLLIPAPSYLEMEGTALSDLGQVTKSANPAKSILINELMRLFYKPKWIHPNSAEIPFGMAKQKSCWLACKIMFLQSLNRMLLKVPN